MKDATPLGVDPATAAIMKSAPGAGIVIAHAGGLVADQGYTNSLEAVLTSIQRGFRLIELDVVELSVLPGEDNFAIAHDGAEKRIYGCDRSFSEIDITEFASLRILQKYTPLTLRGLSYLSAAFPRVRWVIDTKFRRQSAYEAFAALLKQRYPALALHCILQSYNEREAIICGLYGYRSIFALWKEYNRDYFDEGALQIIAGGKAAGTVCGISLRCFRGEKDPQPNFSDPRLARMAALGLPIMLHDLREVSKGQLLAAGFGMYTHSASGVPEEYLGRELV